MIFLDILQTLLLVGLSLECFRVLQACSYKPQRGYVKIFLSSYFILLACTQVVFCLVYFLLPKWYTLVPLAISALLVVVKKRKCPLKFTKRIVRMVICLALVLFCLCYFAKRAFVVVMLPIFVLVSWIVCLPIDICIANYYIGKAVKKLKDSGITVIAITGSYGKTCTKDMLATLLNDAISPKGSCNTPLGIASFINKSNLAGYKYLILEFGARNVGDIKQLCKLFCPQYGIVTGICEQHLVTFKNLQNIVKTKGELVESLPSQGFCVLNGADDNVSFLQTFGLCNKIYTNKKSVMEVSTTLRGVVFKIVSNDKLYHVHLSQISKYIVDTFLVCFEMCTRLGQSESNTISNCQKVKQTPHRMEVSNNGSFWIVDDAYNANIKGVTSCCDTMSQFDNYKIVLTQGIVEGGKLQRELNERCALILGDTFDVVIAIGKYAEYLRLGANKGRCKIEVAKNLVEGTKILQKYVKANCIVVFQNDLPDVVCL